MTPHTCDRGTRKTWPAQYRTHTCPICADRDLRNAKETQEKLAKDPVLAKLLRS